MTIFSSTASPGQRWKMFLPGAASIQSNALSMSTASALIRSRWLNTHARRPPPRTVAGWQPRSL
jgi:hypothetical protein